MAETLQKNIFIGSSKESKDQMIFIARIIEECGHNPIRWDEPNVFSTGQYPLETLFEICKDVDGAILVFSEDDKVWYRGTELSQPRDNLLIEYGIFASSLGRRRAIIATHKTPKLPTDISAISFIELDKKVRSEERVTKWVTDLRGNRVDAVSLPQLNGNWSYEAIASDRSYKISGHCAIDQVGPRLHISGVRKHDVRTNPGGIDDVTVDYIWRSRWAQICDDCKLRVEYEIKREHGWQDGFMIIDLHGIEPDEKPQEWGGTILANIHPDHLSGRITFKASTKRIF